MSNRQTSTHTTIRDLAEGTPDEREAPEPRDHTMSVPALKAGHGLSPAAETGLLPKVLPPNEGTELAESQDASRTTAESQSVTVPQKASDMSVSRSPSVLIIEDTTELAEVIQATLERMNLVTMHETHGGKALTRFNEADPDIILLDIGLPDMTGWKFLEGVKEKRGGDKLPVIIVITAYGDPANRLVAKLQGVHDYLIKPFTADEVERVVASALSGKA
jgi:CheY-like chemotaxis protein